MGKKRGRWWSVLGLTAGVAGACLLAKLYRVAKASCPPFRRRVYGDCQELLDAFASFWRNPGDLASLRSNPRIDRRFVDEVMLAVTGVNGGHLRPNAYTRYALRRGLSSEAVASLSRGEVEHATVDQAPALYFARHYAESRGKPDADLVQRLMATHGTRTVSDVVNLIRLITIGDLIGNTFDAFISRALGRPSPDTTLKSELSVVGLFLFGIVPLLPVLMLRVSRSALPE